MLDQEKIRRESLRWLMILSLNTAAPYGAREEALLSIAQAVYADATELEVKRAVDYLSERELAHLEKQPDGRWFAKLTRAGTDVAEYTVSCDPGIARPEKYWRT